MPVRLADPAAATHLYRIAQEAVGNAIRHGRPSRLDITLAEEPPGRVTLTVRDDGTGPAAGLVAHRRGTGAADHGAPCPDDRRDARRARWRGARNGRTMRFLEVATRHPQPHPS